MKGKGKEANRVRVLVHLPFNGGMLLFVKRKGVGGPQSPVHSSLYSINQPPLSLRNSI